MRGRPRARQADALAAVLIGVLAVGVALTGCGSAARPRPQPPAAPPTTHVQVFHPFRPDGTPAARVVAKRSGSCFTTSVTVAAPRSYRCFAANQILDPCFAPPRFLGQLYCFTAPWAPATRLRVRKLPAQHPLPIRHPWALQLANGDRCVAVSGTADIVDGVALAYTCGDGMAGVRPGSAPLAHAVLRTKHAVVREVAVTVEWRT